MKTIPPEQFKAIVKKVMRDYAPLMRRLATFEAISHLPFEWVRPPERECGDSTLANSEHGKEVRLRNDGDR